MQAYSKHESNGIVYYFDEDTPVRIVFQGNENLAYSREYYYDERKLYFVFCYQGSEEYRFYFDDDILIRYINADKEIFDLGNSDMKVYNERWDFILEEAYAALKTIPK